MSYTTINQQVNQRTGQERLDAHNEQVANQMQAIEKNPDLGKPMTPDEINTRYAGVDSDLLGVRTGGEVSSAGGYFDDPAVIPILDQLGINYTKTTYQGKPAWYTEGNKDYNGGPEGTSKADQTLLGDIGQAGVEYEQAVYAEMRQKYNDAVAEGDYHAAAKYQLEMEQAHENAERIRLAAGYSGGADGSMYITAGELGLRNDNAEEDAGSSGGTGASNPSSDLKALLDQWMTTAQTQANGQVDYAVQQAVTQLQRALEDAQPQFKEQAEAVAKDEMQALDNSALYAEMRGDKGGIGQSQYNEIQAAAAQNRLAVQQAQTKLSTDTARQIADLRAQGEFEKADKMLEISQTYLSQLISLEQWAAEFGLSQQQFQASLQQWQAEYDLAMQQFQVDTELSYAQLTGQLSDGTLTLSGKEHLSGIAETLLSYGVPLDYDQLQSLGLSAEQAAELQAALQLQNAVGSSGGSSAGASVSGGVDLSKMTDAQIYQYLFDSNYTNQNEAAIKAHLQSQGMSSTLAGAIAGAFADTEYFKLKNIADANRVYGESNLLTVPEFGKISYEEAERLEMEGYLMLVGIGKDGKPEYARTNKAYMPDYQVKKG